MQTKFAASSIPLVLGFLFCHSLPTSGAELVYAKDGSGVYGYKDTPVLPWCGYRVHDPDRPAPQRINPGPPPRDPALAPSLLIVLFPGKDLSRGRASNWTLVDGC